MGRIFLLVGCLSGVGVVALAAVGAHVMAGAPGEGLFRTALDMQAWHTPVLLGLGLWLRARGGVWLGGGAVLLLLGLGLFCGALDVHAFSGRSLGPVAPVGGSVLMLGWLVLAVAAVRD